MRLFFAALLLSACADDGGEVASNTGGASSGGGSGGTGTGGAGGSGNAGAGGGAGDRGDACSAASQAGVHAASALGKTLAQGSLRTPHALWDPGSERYVVLFGAVGASGFRTRVLTTRWESDAFATSPELELARPPAAQRGMINTSPNEAGLPPGGGPKDRPAFLAPFFASKMT
ncbi:MAG: hypothetical protein HS104_22525 [Polyangiaceae bacterium]|nr:hypothetical protein [Polyangiaceae bacterium]MCL4750065.1 hypothetical protein [Myxococcales bacterium]